MSEGASAPPEPRVGGLRPVEERRPAHRWKAPRARHVSLFFAEGRRMRPSAPIVFRASDARVGAREHYPSRGGLAWWDRTRCLSPPGATPGTVDVPGALPEPRGTLQSTAPRSRDERCSSGSGRVKLAIARSKEQPGARARSSAKADGRCSSDVVSDAIRPLAREHSAGIRARNRTRFRPRSKGETVLPAPGEGRVGGAQALLPRSSHRRRESDGPRGRARRLSWLQKSTSGARSKVERPGV